MQLYDVAVTNYEEDKLAKAVKKLSIEVPSKELKQREGRARFQSVMRYWLPLSKAVLNMVVRLVPSPKEAHSSKLKKLFPPLDRLQLQQSIPYSELETFYRAVKRVRDSVESCDTSDSAPCVLYVSKMIAIPRSHLPSDEEAESEELAPTRSLPPRQSDLIGMPIKQGMTLCTREEGDLPSWYKSGDTETILSEPLFPKGLVGNYSSQGASDQHTKAQATNVEEGYSASTEGAGEYDEKETFIAFSRILSGCLRPNAPLFVLGPKYDPANPFRDNSAHITQVTSPLRLYMMMGKEMCPLRHIKAGNIVGIKGLGNHILKTATASSTPVCPSLIPMNFQSTPLVRVAIEPKHVADLPALQKGLRLLNQGDPSVEVTTSSTGELQVAAIGELHLERCVKELENRFAGVEVVISEPITTFKESIVKQISERTIWQMSQNRKPHSEHSESEPASDVDANTESDSLLKPGCHFCAKNSTVYATTQDQKISIVLQVFPIPKELADFLNSRVNSIKQLLYRIEGDHSSANTSESQETIENEPGAEWSMVSPQASRFLKELSGILQNEDPVWGLRLREALSLGPHGVGPNVLLIGFDRGFVANESKRGGGGSSYSGSASLDGGVVPKAPEGSESLSGMSETNMRTFWEKIGVSIEGNRLAQTTGETNSDDTARERYLANLRSYFEQGFQLATAEGPMAAEPMWGVSYVLRDVIFHTGLSEAVAEGSRLNTRIITLMKNACHKAFECGAQRIVEAMYKCELHCSGGKSGGGEHLGKLYSVLYKRRGRVISEDILEGTSTFQIVAYLPVVESFGFATELRKQTSGAATSPQLMFSHWEILDVDPYFQPHTEEEQEEFGSEFHEDQFVNVAKTLIDKVRRRKGLDTERKIVVHAEKQRTLAKKK